MILESVSVRRGEELSTTRVRLKHKRFRVFLTYTKKVVFLIIFFCYPMRVAELPATPVHVCQLRRISDHIFVEQRLVDPIPILLKRKPNLKISMI